MKHLSRIPRLRSRWSERAEGRRRRCLERVEELWRVREDWRDISGPISVFPAPGSAVTMPGHWLLFAAA